MTLKYKILATNPTENSVEVRFYTDQVTEQDLACEWDANGNIIRCRADYNIALPSPAPTGAELDAEIVRHAPTKWFATIAANRNGNPDPVMAALTAAKGVEYTPGQIALDILAGLPNDGGVKDLAWHKERKRQQIAAWRYGLEVAGVYVQGAIVRTDRESQAQLLSAYTVLKNGIVTSVDWKSATGGFVTLDLAAVEAISRAVTLHVQACFSAEKAHVDTINACTTLEELNALTTLPV